MTTASGLFFFVLHYARPVNFNPNFYAILMIGGLCAAIVATVPLWACLTSFPFLLRIAILLIAMPIGGPAYALMDYYEPLLFNWQWYSAVTSLQVLLMCIPLLIARSKGYRFARFL
jgi:hypothetical protein